MTPLLLKKCSGELLGTAMLLAVVIGSGIMGERLAAGNVAVALLANTAATVCGLYILIEIVGPISGAHFNPVVSAVMVIRGVLDKQDLLAYIFAQLAGAVLGAWLAHAMFDISLFQLSTKVRSGTGQWIAEMVATAGLLLVILRAPSEKVAAMVAAYIGCAYWFTASTSFANPAVTIARSLSNTFAGIAPTSAPLFILAQLAGALAAVGVFGGWLKGERAS